MLKRLRLAGISTGSAPSWSAVLAPFWIIRPWAGFSVVVMVIVAYFVTAATVVVDWDFIVLISAIFLIGSAGFPLNDIYDLEIDRRAHKERPLVRGHMSVSAAKVQAIAMLLAAIGLAATLGAREALIAGTFCAAIIFYSAVKAWQAALANVLTAVLFAAAIPAPLFIQDGPFDKQLLFGFAGVCALLIFGREVVKDIQDREIDLIHGRKTIPIVHGVDVGYRLGGLSVALAGIAAVFISIDADMALRALALALAVFLFAAGFSVHNGTEASAAKSWVTRLRVIMLVAIATLGIGATI